MSAAAIPTGRQGDVTGEVGLVEIERVSKVFGMGARAVHALADVELQIRPGEFVALVGSSGCGKSTLLRMLAGLSMPTRGSILVGGEKLTAPRLDIGMMLQQPTLLPWRTAVENVLLPVDAQRKPRAADRARANELIDLVGLSRFRDHYPRELSGGMQQRVALARVLQRSPGLMLLDEPFGALDDFTRESLNLELAGVVSRQGASVVLVTHNIGEAIFLSDRIVTLGGRPGVVRGIVTNRMERPRPLSAMRSPEFQGMVEEVRTFLGLD